MALGTTAACNVSRHFSRLQWFVRQVDADHVIDPECVNSYGAPPAQYTAPPSTTTAASGGGGGGGGATKTIVVAPTKGVLRFIPFAMNASVGDTLHYVWGAGPHTVTQSSILEPCNKTSAPGSFTSGPQNATFICMSDLECALDGC